MGSGNEVDNIGDMGSAFERDFHAREVRKSTLDYMSAPSLRELIKLVNEYNRYYADRPILKGDIAGILKEGEGYILLYYK